MNKEPLIIIAGPTASGKSHLAVSLARSIGGEIISADSMQVYRGMDIGTAKVTAEEMEGVPHHLIDILDPDEEFNVFLFRQYAAEAVRAIRERDRIPIVAGGTGFYIQALLYDVRFTEMETDPAYLDELSRIAETEGAEALHAMLREVDPDSAAAIHCNNIKRVTRALEYHHLTGRPISEHNREERGREPAYQALYYVLEMDRARLYDRINRRVDLMMEQGFLEEVRRLYAEGIKPEMTSMQGLGYKELMAHLGGGCDLDTAVHMIKQNTRHFAKRQLTWYRRERGIRRLPAPESREDEERLIRQIREDMKQLWN